MLKKVMVVKELDENGGCGLYTTTLFDNAMKQCFLKN